MQTLYYTVFFVLNIAIALFICWDSLSSLIGSKRPSNEMKFDHIQEDEEDIETQEKARGGSLNKKKELIKPVSKVENISGINLVLSYIGVRYPFLSSLSETFNALRKQQKRRNLIKDVTSSNYHFQSSENQSFNGSDMQCLPSDLAIDNIDKRSLSTSSVRSRRGARLEEHYYAFLRKSRVRICKSQRTLQKLVFSKLNRLERKIKRRRPNYIQLAVIKEIADKLPSRQ